MEAANARKINMMDDTTVLWNDVKVVSAVWQFTVIWMRLMIAKCVNDCEVGGEKSDGNWEEIDGFK